MASIKDVAKRAKVGIATVSRVLNKNGYVAKETKEKVEQAIDELNYRPNELARNLVFNRSGIVGVLVPNIENPFFSSIVRYIEAKLYQYNYKTMLCCTIDTSNREKEYFDLLDKSIVDGIITATHTENDEEYLKINKPIVSLDRDFGNKIPLICSDHKKEGYLAAKKLLSCGCKNVVQFGGILTDKGNIIAGERHMEFERIMKLNNIHVYQELIERNRLDYQYYSEVAYHYIRHYNQADGIFAADTLAIYLYNYARKSGIKIPEQLKIVGFDGTEITRLANPQLTAIVQDIDKLAGACVDTLIKMIQGEKDLNYYQIIDVSFQEGGTT